MIKIAIVEDDLVQCRELNDHLKEYFNGINKAISVESFESGDKFLETFEPHKFHMIFMDIEMPGTDGMTVSKKLRKMDENVLLLFVTNLAQYALESYEVYAFDYIVKPVNYFNLALKMKRAVGALKNLDNATIITNTTKGQVVLDVSQIRYVEVMKHNIIYHTTKGDYLVGYDSMKAVREKLEKYDFVLCDRSFLVNLKYVTGINKDDLYLGDDVLKITKSRRAEFTLALTKYFSAEANG